MAPKKRRAPRKSTFTVRKEEKERLEREIAALETRLQSLQRDFATCASADDRSCRRRALVRDRHVACMGLRSLLSAYFSSPQATAFAAPIHLPRAEAARRAMLHHGSAAQIRDARLLIRERCRALDLSQPHVATEWFERDDGSMVIVQLDVTPFHGVRCSVHDVYDAVGFFAQNVEIYISEHLGDLTVREDDDVTDDAKARVSQRRLTSATSVGLMIDANVTVFRQYFAEGACAELRDEHAIFGTQPVESDELYPYVPEERVRHDLEGACIIQQVETRDGERVTTLARLSVITRHSTNGRHLVPFEMQAPLRSLAMQWGDLMLLAVRERIYRTAAAAPSTVTSTASTVSSSSPSTIQSP